MKFNNLTKGVITFSVLSMLASGALMANAASDTAATSTVDTANKNHGRGFSKEARIKPEDMTDAQKAAMAAKKVEMDAKKAEMDTKMTAVKAALTASDYTAWVAAEKTVNANSPLLTKITVDNFSKYVEANKLRTQADAIMKDLGIDGPGMSQGMGGFGPGRDGGFGHGDKPGQK
ncbi:MAG: hypothetical protein NTY31_01195 [Candidatus Falkowbacteria bacterium]|nr:hypothetical protein [Candidatus Falkowbacteria bacterium]